MIFNAEIDKTIEQATAILNSLNDKWIPICDGAPLTRDNIYNCACCQKWWGSYDCEGCPIFEKMGLSYCQLTPMSDPNLFRTEKDYAELVFLVELRTELFERLADEMEEWLESK